MTDLYILNENDEPVAIDDVMTWGRWFETADRKVAKDTVGSFDISTVFLGLNHGYGDGPPLLYETMVFRLDGDGERSMSEDTMRRYTTRDEAVAGHAEVVAELLAATQQPAASDGAGSGG